MTVLDRWLKQNDEVEVLDIDLDTGIELFDRTFDDANKEQLPEVGYYLERLSYLLGEHTEQWWTNWSDRHGDRELEIEADFFDCYLQQSVSFDADVFIDPLPKGESQSDRALADLESEYNSSTTTSTEISTVELETIIDQSHAEDLPGWSKQIENYLLLHNNRCTIAELIDDLPLTSGVIICTLLMGNFDLEQQGDDFYDGDSINVSVF